MNLDRIRAVIFDWAGTTVDLGSRAPVEAFMELFRRHGVALTEAQARGPMGTPKKDHVRALLAIEAVADLWTAAHGARPGEPEVQALYAEFIPLQKEVLRSHCGVIPGTAELIQELRRHGVRIGSTTGYTRDMISELEVEAARGGFRPEVTVCADEAPAGRPAPWMALLVAMRLNAYPVWACVKVGDTAADMAEGVNAGMWAVAVARTGNEMDAPPGVAEARLRAAGAHYVTEDIRGVLPLLGEIDSRLKRGERP